MLLLQKKKDRKLAADIEKYTAFALNKLKEEIRSYLDQNPPVVSDADVKVIIPEIAFFALANSFKSKESRKDCCWTQ
jgi:hypothetical protein